MTVEQIQCLLTYLGYNPGAVDGVNGLKTAAAVLVFQQQEGLRQDGVPGPETQEALLSAVATGRMYTPVMGNQSPDWWGDIRYFKRDEFRCPCGQILQNPNVKTSQTTTNFLKQKNDKKDLANVGLGLG